MRPWRIGTSSGSRLVACSAMMSTGLLRPAGGAQAAWSERGTARRAAFPLPVASSALTWSTRFSSERSTLVPGPTSSAPASTSSSTCSPGPASFLGTVVAVFLGSVVVGGHLRCLLILVFYGHITRGRPGRQRSIGSAPPSAASISSLSGRPRNKAMTMTAMKAPAHGPMMYRHQPEKLPES